MQVHAALTFEKWFRAGTAAWSKGRVRVGDLLLHEGLPYPPLGANRCVIQPIKAGHKLLPRRVHKLGSVHPKDGRLQMVGQGEGQECGRIEGGGGSVSELQLRDMSAIAEG